MSDFRNLEIKRWPQVVRVEWSCEKPDDSDATPEASGDPDYADEEAERHAAWRRDEWHFHGVRAKASIFVPIGSDSFACYELTSPGIWGVESDSDAAYIAEIYADEKTQLRDALKAIGYALDTESGAKAIETEA